MTFIILAQLVPGRTGPGLITAKYGREELLLGLFIKGKRRPISLLCQNFLHAAFRQVLLPEALFVVKVVAQLLKFIKKRFCSIRSGRLAGLEHGEVRFQYKFGWRQDISQQILALNDVRVDRPVHLYRIDDPEGHYPEHNKTRQHYPAQQ